MTIAEFAAFPMAHSPAGMSALESEICYTVEPAPYFHWKETLGRVVAAILLLPALPAIGALVLLARWSTGASGVYRQQRVGKGGKVFWIYKIRSMRADAERNGAQWSTNHDSRVTRLGKFFRKVHLDELPQLVNVVRGEMALIGPRPERPEFVPVLVKVIPDYLDRLAVLPGVTGLAQINLPPDTNLDCVRRKLVLDLEYVERAGLWLDVRILLCTLVRIVGIPGTAAMSLFALQRTVVIEEHDRNDEYLTPSALGNCVSDEVEEAAMGPTLHDFSGAAAPIPVAKPR